MYYLTESEQNNLITWLQRTHHWRLIIFLLAAILIRLVLYYDFPALITNDSVDYILLSEGLYQHNDWANPRLGGIRMPLYPMWLTLIHVGSQFTSSDVVGWQIGLGLGSLGLGVLLGKLLHSRLVTEVMTLFLAFNPVYLLNDHTIMSEGLFGFTLLLVAIIVVKCTHQKLNGLHGLILGLVGTLCLLTRANGLLFFVPLVVAIVLKNSHQKTHILKFGVGLLIGLALFLIPWLGRNYTLFGIISLSNYNQRNLLIYQSVNHLIDVNLPQFSQLSQFYDPTQPHTIYTLIEHLGADPKQAEIKAQQLVQEQLRNHPLRYLRAVTLAILNFTGYPDSRRAIYAMADVEWWFANLVGNLTQLHTINSNGGWYTYTSFRYIQYGEDNRQTYLWSRAGQFYLNVIRWQLFDLFLLSWLGYIFYQKRNLRQMTLGHLTEIYHQQDWAILVFGGTYLITILAHAVTLSDSDRYTTPFDWLLILVISLIATRLIRQT